MRLAALIGIMLAASPALAQDEAYLDDRSTPEAVISSYYNAISRHEYARAYSYFGGGAAPAYARWQAGYGSTATVAVSFGDMAEEGAAGSTYYTLPVSLAVTDTKGRHQYFSGCYQLRLVQPANQSPPFEGIHIESASLHVAKARASAPAKCD